jgi:hypothetical protein
MKSRQLAPLLLSIVVLCGCESSPDSAGPSVQQATPVIQGLVPAPQPRSIAEYRNKNLQKTDLPPADETSKPSTSTNK